MRNAGQYIKQGARVALSSAFLRSIGAYGDVAQSRGTVERINHCGPVSLAYVVWDNEREVSRACLIKNLVAVDRLHLDPA